MRERSRLVEHGDAGATERLERTAALDEHAELRRAGDAGNDGDRHGEDQRAGCRHDQHGERADRVARPDPGAAGEQQSQGEEPEREAVRHANGRGLALLGLLDEADDRCIGAFRGGTQGDEIEGRADRRRAAQRFVAAPQRDGQGLAGQRRGVDHALVAGDGAVHGQHFALADEQRVARQHGFDRHLFEALLRVLHGGARHPAEQRGHLAARAALGIVFEILAARIH